MAKGIFALRKLSLYMLVNQFAEVVVYSSGDIFEAGCCSLYGASVKVLDHIVIVMVISYGDYVFLCHAEDLHDLVNARGLGNARRYDIHAQTVYLGVYFITYAFHQLLSKSL